ncbi:MAG: gamma-glutamyltransferase [Acidobacteria bacterium]|nr:gamma-glutamyltransferase [Acidobacteriota bacterium]
MRSSVMRTLAVAGLAGVLVVASVLAAPQLPVQRPPVIGRSAGISTGHPLTTAAAHGILVQGGNAFDAGVAAMLVGGVVEQDLYSLGGEGHALVYPQREKKVSSVNGQGWAPAFATIDWFTSRHKNFVGIGLDPAVVPGVLHAALTILERWGTMSFAQVSARAIDYAANGFPLRPLTTTAIDKNRAFIDKWPDNRRMWLRPDGASYQAGETIALPDLAATLRRMVEAERGAASRGRAAGIVAARDRFYKGDIAAEMVAFLRAQGYPWELSDFAEYSARVEAPATTRYRGYDVYTQGFNSQGPSLLEALNILETMDVRSMKRNSAPYLHALVEALKLAYADRDTYYGDPAFVNTPAEGLLSKAYARERAARIDPKAASRAFVAGDPLPFDSKIKSWTYFKANIADGYQPGPLPPDAEPLRGILRDTTHIAIVDKDGNVFDSTPSGAWIPTAVVLGRTGILMSVRGESFWLDPTHAAQVRPHARPRYTLSPAIVLRAGEPFMAFGTPGGDNQVQTMLQAFLGVVEFWPEWYPNLHAAFEWPRFQTLHFFGSFYPHTAGFNKLNVEAAMTGPVIDELKALGHDVTTIAPQSIASCATAVIVDPATKNRIAGADPRRDCYAIAY